VSGGRGAGAGARTAARVRAGALALAGALLLLLLLLLLLPSPAARAHELQPSLLSLTELAPGEYDVLWRVPAELGLLEAPAPVFPPEATRQGGGVRVRDGDMVVERFRLRAPGGLAGRTLDVRVRRGTGSEVLVRIAGRDGRATTGRIQPGRAPFVVPGQPRALAVAGTYLVLGIEHILTGLDHLAFVLGLVLLTPAWRKLWKTVTAFTVAHSLTLALAALGLVRVPPPPVEAVIALSILFVAREAWNQRRGRPSATARRPWPVAFAFGLLHGLGFAGALSQVGLPEGDIPLALFTFNVGVELGQLAFVLVVLALARPLALLVRRAGTARERLELAPAYLIGALAAFWCLERVVGFWP
jgi:hydrogenase/urease accessory protein HupE